jgi:uncharacterized damage-inducible protein DinB
MKQHFAMLAGYNRWANVRLYDAAANLADAEYRAERGAFFGSLHRTLNHLVVTDRIWMRRFTGEGQEHLRLDELPYDSLATLRAAREKEDERIAFYVDRLSEADIAGVMTYSTITDPRVITQTRGSALAHFFNHQTHHRGQAHCLLTIGGGRDAAPSLDLLLFQLDTGTGMA